MKPLRGGLVTALMAGSLVVMPTSNPRSTRAVTRDGTLDPKAIYTPTEKEFWLTADDLGYIRPGFNITVNSVTIPADRRPDSGLFVHGRLRPAARPQRQGHAGHALDQPGAGVVGPGFPALHLVHDARPDGPETASRRRRPRPTRVARGPT